MSGNPYGPDEIRAVVSVACPVCEGLTPVAEGKRDWSVLVITCNHCAREFEVPSAAIHDAQKQCLAALGGA